MISLARSLLAIYPDLDLFSTVKIANYGDGDVIEFWGDARPQPTNDELLEAVIAAAKQQRITDLKADCTNAIQSGFVSNALGENHTYDSSLPQDQTNLLGAKIAGIDMYFTCTDSAGYKSQKFHTVAQMAQVYQAGMVHLQTQKARFYARKLAVEQAATIDAINAVVW